MQKRTVVPSVATLRAMAKACLIELHRDTGRKVGHWTGQLVTARYIEKALVPEPFEFRGRRYRLKYFDGCSCPFVVDIDFAKEIGLDLNGVLIA